jgi:hypothetical protein
MVKLVDLEKKNSRIIYIYIFIKFLTNIKKKKLVTNYLILMKKVAALL